MHTFIKNQSWKKVLAKKLYKKSQGIIVPSKVLKAMCIHFNLHSSIQVVSNPFDPEICRTKANAFKQKEVKAPFFLFIGSLYKVKGIDILLKAYLASTNCPAKLVVIGEGPLTSYIKDEIRKSGTQNVVLLGKQKNPFPWLSEAEALLVPSREETFGYVVLEALALNKAVVTSNTEGVCELLNKTHRGKRIKKEEWESFFNNYNHENQIEESNEALSDSFFHQFRIDNVSRLFDEVIKNSESINLADS
jgi:glycosyltransferase involved in cell wall biosynthesis